MNFVYKITFEKRKELGIMPYLYIGSKSNAIYENGMIIDRSGRPYYGSSAYKGYHDLINNDFLNVEIVKEFDNHADALNYEAMLQKSLDVVADPRYFNLSIATTNNFTDPNFASYKHTVTGKTVRLERTHPKVISGEYVGVSKGTVFSEEERKKRSLPGDQNGFYGKKHSKKTKDKIISSRRKTYEENPEKYEEVKSILAETARKTFTGVPKSEEQRRKMGRKDLIMLKNKIDGRMIRIHRDDKKFYDENVWMNPYKLSKNKSTGSRWVTNGVENKKIKKGEEKPEGWEYGRSYNGWNKMKGTK